MLSTLHGKFSKQEKIQKIIGSDFCTHSSFVERLKTKSRVEDAG
jgi:hypothetical protein